MKTKTKTLPLIGGGAVIGALNGLLGGGGGMVAVPLLRRAGYPAPKAHATAIAVILPACVTSSIVYLIKGFIPLHLFVPTALGVLLGGFLGAKLLGRLPVKIIEFAFAVFMLIAGVRMLF